MTTIDELLAAFDLHEIAPDRYRATNLPDAHGVVFGGQLLAQALLAAGRGHDGMTAKTIHTVFARSARPELPLEIVVDPMHAGRTFASSTVTISQGDRLCTRSSVLLHVLEDDHVRHAIGPATSSSPDDAIPMPGTPGTLGTPGTPGVPGQWEVRVVGGVDLADPAAVGPAELDVWTRFVGAPSDPASGQALLAFASDGFLIGTAMRPHPGVGQAQAHVTLSTGVISHTLTFHEPVDAGEWMLLSQTSPYAGHGRSYGRADVFRADGTLIASFVQDAMIRPTARAGAPP